ncbi:alpha/beta fold hydrolase [Nocardia crassostreae]|uniref:alpha/beta fold hydrolase n=1 Tax=Nocardia crassostreae TaxID=53428 RepID=UPI000829BCE4|nr:alpha/beta hydrolase [Nocardia crassostreae]
MARESVQDRLSEITCPALVLRGEFDPASTAEKSEALAAGLAGSGPVVTIPGSGHAANWTDPDLVNEAIGGFLTRLTSPAAR